jgi:hypothetical protein
LPRTLATEIGGVSEVGVPDMLGRTRIAAVMSLVVIFVFQLVSSIAEIPAGKGRA